MAYYRKMRLKFVSKYIEMHRRSRFRFFEEERTSVKVSFYTRFGREGQGEGRETHKYRKRFNA